jgi:hypothetical protein
MIDSPCKKDCPDRNETCHVTCEKYIAYDEENKKRRKKQQEENERRWAAYAFFKGQKGKKKK